jgi:hypothetical protein
MWRVRLLVTHRRRVPAATTGSPSPSTNTFGSGPGNLAFSPLSIRTALSLALAGARGETAAQIARALCVPEGEGLLHADVAALVRQLQAHGSNLALTVANSLWAQEGAPLQPAFLDIVAQHYEGAMHLVDFRRAPGDARAAINRWVEEATQGKLAGVIPSGALPTHTAAAGECGHVHRTMGVRVHAAGHTRAALLFGDRPPRRRSTATNASCRNIPCTR